MTPRAQERTVSGVERERERPSLEFCPLFFLFQARSLGSGLREGFCHLLSQTETPRSCGVDAIHIHVLWLAQSPHLKSTCHIL